MAKLDQSIVMQALDWAYDKAVNGLPGTDSAVEMADSYARRGGTVADQADSLIRWQVAKSSANGFVTGLGGIVLIPVTLPANITVNLYVQLRMVAAIAHLGGYDVRDDQVRTLCYVCLLGSAANDLLREVGAKVGTKFAVKAVEGVSKQVVIKINQKVGFRLLTKFGEKGIVNLVKLVPVVGGVIGAAFDGPATYAIGKVAKRAFLAVEK